MVEPSTEIAVYPTTFLQQYRIYRVIYHTPYKPLLSYLGFAPALPLYSLLGNPQAFRDLTRTDAVDLATLDQGIHYATVFLEVTRRRTELVSVVSSINQIRFRRRLTPGQIQTKEVLCKKYASILTPPTGEETEDGYLLTTYVVRQRELEQYTFKISRKGDIKSHITVLERSMPVVIGI